MKRFGLTLVLVLGFGVGGSANATQIEITYALETTYTLVGVVELGPSSIGSMKVAYPATANSPLLSSTTGPGGTFGGAVIPHGPVHLSLLTLPPIFVNVTILGDLITGTLALAPTGYLFSLSGSLMKRYAITSPAATIVTRCSPLCPYSPVINPQQERKYRKYCTSWRSRCSAKESSS